MTASALAVTAALELLTCFSSEPGSPQIASQKDAAGMYSTQQLQIQTLQHGHREAETT